MWCLFLTTVLPQGAGSGGEIVSLSAIEAIQRAGLDVRVLGYQRPQDPAVNEHGHRCLGRRPIETSSAGTRAGLWLLAALVLRAPYSQTKYRSRRLRREVARALRSGPALVVVDHAQMGFAIAHTRPAVPIVLIAHNVEADGYARLAASARGRVGRWLHGREARLMARAEANQVRRCDQVWALTGRDAEHFARLGGAGDVRTLTVPSRCTTGSTASRPIASEVPRCDVALIGNWTWRPNAQGLRWFVDEVLPRLPSTLTIQIAGRGAEWLRGRHDNVDVRGVVPDAQHFLSASRVVAVPSSAGGGVQVKTLDAIACASSVVATSVAVRGLDDLPASVSVADDGRHFADALIDAVARPTAQGARRAAVAWSTDRSTRFENSVRTAVSDLLTPASDAPESSERSYAGGGTSSP